MVLMKFSKVLLSVCIFFVIATTADTLNVDVYPCSPLVIENDGEFSGLEVDIIRRIAYENNHQIKFNKVNSFSNIFDGVKSVLLM